PQIAEAGMHLAANRAAVRTCASVGRQQACLRPDLVEVLGDRERVPYLDPLVLEAGHEERWGPQQQLGARRRVVAAHDLLVELEAGHPAKQPTAKSPGRVILA